MTKKADDLARTLDADLSALWDYVDRIKALSRSVEDHASGLRPIAADLGVTGQVEDVAAESLASLATQGVALSDQFAAVSSSVSQAREALVEAQNAYRALPEGGLDGWQVVAVTAAKVVVPGVGTLAGDAAAVYWTAQNAQEREVAAGKALQTLTADLGSAAASAVALDAGSEWTDTPSTVDPTVTDSTASGTSTSGSTRRSVATVSTIGSTTPTTTTTISTTTPLTPTPTDTDTGTTPHAPVTPLPPTVDRMAPGSPTSGGSTSADGHLTGGTVPGTVQTGLPGALPGSTVGGTGLGLSGSGIGSGRAGGALAGGLAAGVTALGSSGLSRLGSTGGLLGTAGTGGTALGGSGLSSTGASSGVLGGSRSVSSAGSTLRGTSGSSLVEGSPSTTAAGAAGGRASSSSSGMMPGGGAGGAGGGKDKRRRAGGGLIAPGFEDDDRQVAVPLGAGARAGSRDQLPVVLEVEEPDDTW